MRVRLWRRRIYRQNRHTSCVVTHLVTVIETVIIVRKIISKSQKYYVSTTT